MGKPAAHLGDMGSNHGAWHPSLITSGSDDVFTNGIPAVRQGDSLAPHVKPKSKPHGRSIGGGSSTVLLMVNQRLALVVRLIVVGVWLLVLVMCLLAITHS